MNNLGRIFFSPDFGFDFSATLVQYGNFEEFLFKNGIKNPESAYKECVWNGIFGKRLGAMKNRFEGFCAQLAHAIENNKLGLTNSLVLLSDKDGTYNETQIGWFSIDAYLDKKGENFVVSFIHKLRSVDLHDGFLFNLYFCIELSKDIIEEVQKSTKKTLELGKLKIEISHLHAYLDNFPKLGEKNDH